MKKFTIKTFLKKITNTVLGLFTFLAIVGGSCGLTITAMNPVNLWWSIAPIQTPFFIITYSKVMGYLAYLQDNYWNAIGISAGLMLLGFIVQIRSMESLKKVPMAIIKSPITIYNDVKKIRI